MPTPPRPTHDADAVTRSSAGDWRAGPAAEFLPGDVVAGRYRMVSLIGRGGMGEVYRADDLKLGQTVALKFLPQAQADDAGWRERFLGEVRTARQISHPNVCRVYDVGEVDGRQFLTMEYIEGEDLASLLRRIGRLPEEKAVQIARQLCAGLAAAHDRGIIHRDLKPANVMLDDRGIARITDFGLAGAAQTFRGAEVRHGTPAYMAPEQAAGHEVTARSDIYALGLVLHELFTGRRVSDLRDVLSNPSAIDPLVERAIAACLAVNPQERPASPLQVAAMLPGGDPLAAALAAGETPSPELVAGAATIGSLSLPAAASLVVAVLILMAGHLLMAERVDLHRLIPMPYSPAQLSLRAEQILADARWAPARHTRYGFELDRLTARNLSLVERTPAEWTELRTSLRDGTVAPLLFWYRSAAQPLVPLALDRGSSDPPFFDADELRVWLAPNGQLRRLEAAPPADVPPGGDTEPDWTPLFRDAGLDIARFTRVRPDWRPPVYADTVYRWNPAAGAGGARVAAASAGGKPVWFEIVAETELPRHIAPVSVGLAERTFWGLIVGFYAMVLAGALVLAQRNVRLGRSDRRGAVRLAAFAFLLGMFAWTFGTHHSATLEELRGFGLALGESLLGGAILFVGYLALEPIVRRRWPDRLISWTRVLAGDWRDPMVGRDVLAGTIGGLVMTGANAVGVWVATASGGKQGVSAPAPEAFEGFRGLASVLASVVVPSIAVPLSILVFIVLLSIVVRRINLAVAAFAILFTAVLSLQEPPTPAHIALSAIAATSFTAVIARVGLLAAVIAHVTFFLITRFPLTLDVSVWYLPAALAPVLALLAFAAFGAVTAAGGRRAFARLLPE